MKTSLILLILLTPFSMKAQTLPEIALKQFEGDWYVIGYKPNRFDKKWINTVEGYTWDAKKNRYDVLTTYNTRRGGRQKSISQKLLPVANSNNARWTARIWLFVNVDYVIYRVADDYSYVVVGHPEQKYLYIMSRKPRMSEELYEELVSFSVSALGYKREDIRKQLQESRI
jgi:apolipoprotein D and lipocalin family protein